MVALPAEAGAQRLLSAEAAHGHEQRFQSDQGIQLLVTGVGHKNLNQSFARFARSSLQRSQQVSPAWLNIGIAGHRDLAVGEMMVPMNRLLPWCAVLVSRLFCRATIVARSYG